SLKPDRLEDVWLGIRQVAEALEAPRRGEELIRRLQGRMAEIAARARPIKRKPVVACVEWIEPLMASGNWMPELVEMAGGVNAFGVAGQHAPGLNWEEFAAADPDFIVVLPCGFNLLQTRQDMHFMTLRREWDSLRAVQVGHVYLTDGNQFFNRP